MPGERCEQVVAEEPLEAFIPGKSKAALNDAINATASEILTAAQDENNNIPPILVQVAEARLGAAPGREHDEGTVTQDQLCEAIRDTAHWIIGGTQMDDHGIPPHLVQAAEARLDTWPDQGHNTAPPTQAQMNDAICATAANILAHGHVRGVSDKLPAAIVQAGEAQPADLRDEHL